MTISELQMHIQDGYVYQMQHNVYEAYKSWKQAFLGFLKQVSTKDLNQLCDLKGNLDTAPEILQWLDDFQENLSNFMHTLPEVQESLVELLDAYLARFKEGIENKQWRIFFMTRAQATFLLGRKEESEAMFKKELKHAPSFLDVWLCWADCWLYHGTGYKNDYVSALKVLKWAGKYNEKTLTGAYYKRLTDVYIRLGEEEDAKLAKMQQKELEMLEKQSV